MKLLAEERNPLFDDITKNLENNEQLYGFIHSILVRGARRTYVPGNPIIDLASTFSFIRKEGGKIQVHNKIFEMIILTYLKPLINGVGFYELETQTADEKRLDIVLIYGSHRYIIELKLWYGEKRHGDAYHQLIEYLDAQNEQTGYLLTFDFREVHEQSAQWVEIGGKRIFDVIV